MATKSKIRKNIRTKLSADGELSGFNPVPDILIKKYAVEKGGFATAIVWARVWRYCQMSDHVCRASLGTIAKGLGMTEKTVLRHIHKLVRDKYLKDKSPKLRNRPHVYTDTGKVALKLKASISAEGNSHESDDGRVAAGQAAEIKLAFARGQRVWRSKSTGSITIGAKDCPGDDNEELTHWPQE